MKRFATGVLIGFLLASLFSAPWVYQAWAVGNCAVYRSWNTGDSVTAGDLNSSFTTAAVTNSTPQCLDDYSATVSQMQTTTDPYASGTESQATSTAGELERLRFMFKQIFGLTNWYRHDQAPTFNSLAGHAVTGAIHVGSMATDLTASRFPRITGPNHWTGIWFPHATTHMAISIADYNHAQGGTQGGIELFRFHAGGLILHHTVSIMFKHSESSMHGGQRGHVTALSIDPLTNDIILGHRGSRLRINSLEVGGEGGTSKALFIASTGHVYANTISASGGGSAIFVMSPLNAALPDHQFAFPALAKHTGSTVSQYALMYSDINHQWAHWAAVIPTGATTATLEIVSSQGAAVAGSVGWHVEARTAGFGEIPDTVTSHVYTFYPTTVRGTVNQLLVQTETVSGSISSGKTIYLSVRRINTGSQAVGNTVNGFTYPAEHTAFRYGILRFQ